MFVLVQYGQTQSVAVKVMIGQRSDLLTPTGLELASAYCEALMGVEFDLVYAAQSGAAEVTAVGITAHYSDTPRIDLIPALCEPSGGEFEGHSYAELRKKLAPKQYRLWERDEFVAPPGGESLADMTERGLIWFDAVVMDKTVGLSALIVVGPWMMRALTAMLSGVDLLDVNPVLLPYYYQDR